MNEIVYIFHAKFYKSTMYFILRVCLNLDAKFLLEMLDLY